MVLQIERGREPERAERRDSGRGRLRGIARGLGEEAGGGQGKQEVAGAASALATEQLRGEGEEDDREEEVGWASAASLGQVGR